MATPPGPPIPLAELLKAEQLGVRLEYVGGLPLGESYPVYRHQKAVDRIRAAIERVERHGQEPCACIDVADVYVAFPDGSLKRPDVSIFCREPDETEEAIRMVPEAVIEVVSRGFEAKDLEIGPRFSLSQGVKDVVVFDPATLVVLHVRADGARRMVSPVDVELECGCRCRV